MFASFVQPMVDACNQRVVVFADWCAESEAGLVQSVANARVVRRIIPIAKGLIEVTGVSGKVEDGRINAQVARIQGGNVAGPECGDAAAGVHILDVSSAHRRCRNCPYRRNRFPPTCPFIIEKEKRSIFLKRSSDRPSENVTDQLRRFIVFAASNRRLFDEVVVGAGNGVAMVFVQRTMK